MQSYTTNIVTYYSYSVRCSFLLISTITSVYVLNTSIEQLALFLLYPFPISVSLEMKVHYMRVVLLSSCL
jgi:hypothetical protein